MKTYQLQFRDTSRRWRGGATFQMVPALLREFLDYLTSSVNRLRLGGKVDDEYRVIQTECKNPQYLYIGAQYIIDLRDFKPY